jgi:hypothetical protein
MLVFMLSMIQIEPPRNRMTRIGIDQTTSSMRPE